LAKARDLYCLLVKKKRDERPASWVVRNIFGITFEYIGILGASLVIYYAEDDKKYIAMLLFGILAGLPKLIMFITLLFTSNVRHFACFFGRF
jgi:hypothetical protein